MVPPVEGHGVKWVRGGFLLTLAACAMVAVIGQGQDGTKAPSVIRFSNCLICHLQFEEQLGGGAHGPAGVVCDSCHGESRGHLDDEHNNVKPDRTFTDDTEPALCAECHQEAADRYAAAATSRSNNGPPACHVCHGSHRLATLDGAQRTARKLKIRRPHGRARAPTIESVSPSRERVELFEPLVTNLVLGAEYENPFDPDDIRVDAVFSAPSGETRVLPCFYLRGGNTSSRWQARFTPSETGTYGYQIRVEVAGMVLASDRLSLQVTESERRGFLHANDDSDSSLRLDSGALLNETGVSFTGSTASDIAWGPTFRQLGGLGPKLARVCLGSDILPFGREGSGPVRHNLNAPRKLDRILDLAEHHGIYVILALGGIASPSPRGTSASEVARPAARRQLRYIVARWGYSTSIAAWEFGPEDEGDEGPADGISTARDDMAATLREVDPYGHPIRLDGSSDY